MAGPELMPDPTAALGSGPRNDQTIRPGLDYRQVNQPYEMKEPWHIPSSGAAEEAGELSRAFDEFSKASSSVGNQVLVRQAKIAGTAAGNQPGFQPKTGIEALTNAGQAYNAAAGVSYLNSMQSDIEKQISDAEMQNPRDPAAYAAHAQAVRDATLKEVPQLYLPEVQNYLDRRIAAGQVRVSQQTLMWNQRDAEFSYTSTREARLKAAIDTASQLGGDAGTAAIQQFAAQDKAQRQALVASNAWSQQRADAEGVVTNEMAQQAVHQNYAHSVAHGFMNTLQVGGVDMADQELAKYLQDPKNSDDDKQRVLNEFERQREQYTTFQSQAHAPEISDLGKQLVQGTGLPNGQGAYGVGIENQIRDMYNRGWITDQVMHGLIDQAQRNADKAIKMDAGNQAIDTALHGGQPLDPGDHKVVAATGPYFEGLMKQQNAAYGDPIYASSAVSFTHTTNIVPPTVRSHIRIGLSSADPNQVVYAAQLSQRLTAANSRAAVFDFNETKLAAFAHTVNDAVNSGMDANSAVQLARTQVDVTPAQKTARQQVYKEQLKQDGHSNAQALQANLQQQYGHWYSHAAAAPADMRAEYDSMTQAFFQETGDLKSARALAAQQVTKNWGIDAVNGKNRFVKWAIPQDQVTRVRQDIADTAKANNFQGDPSTIQLLPLPGYTDQSQGRYWGLQYTGKDGLTHSLLGPNNQQVIFDAKKSVPDFATARDELAAHRHAVLTQQRAQQQRWTSDITGAIQAGLGEAQ